MHHHAVVVGVSAVAMGLPVRLFYMEFHISPDQSNPFHVQQSVPEVRTGRYAGSAGIDDPNPLAGLGAQAGLTGRPFCRAARSFHNLANSRSGILSFPPSAIWRPVSEEGPAG